MRVVIATDMEGAAGIDSVHQCFPHHADAFGDGRRHLTADVNAAIRGLQRGGADEIKVIEGHAWGAFQALKSTDLEGQPDVLRGRGSIGGLLSWAEAVALVGYHAMAGTPDGFLSHTVTGATALQLNGRSVGEMVMTAAVFGKAGIPVVMVTGDHATVREAAEFLPWATGVTVKRAASMAAAMLIPREAATEAIEQAAASALVRLAECPPYRVPEPTETRVQFRSSEIADAAMALPLARRHDDRTVAFDAPTIEEAIRFFGACVHLNKALVRDPHLMTRLEALPEVRRIRDAWFDGILQEWLETPDTFAADARALRLVV